jgi:hypothetical protein
MKRLELVKRWWKELVREGTAAPSAKTCDRAVISPVNLELDSNIFYGEILCTVPGARPDAGKNSRKSSVGILADATNAAPGLWHGCC